LRLRRSNLRRKEKNRTLDEDISQPSERVLLDKNKGRTPKLRFSRLPTPLSRCTKNAFRFSEISMLPFLIIYTEFAVAQKHRKCRTY
jgi:hypothetical protein